MLHLVGSGEAGSKLGEMLNKVAEYYSRQLTSKTDTFLKILNPVLLIIIAGIITLIILGVITPIMQMNSMI
jgi:general secretion pathway protein F